mmetsp:Transcript_12528/g.38263  ORF Transcript_12528/g.38263 Transcript_12528/m.38263 type:complete len:299 (+) Transcript_12528:37-933(+)
MARLVCLVVAAAAAVAVFGESKENEEQFISECVEPFTGSGCAVLEARCCDQVRTFMECAGRLGWREILEDAVLIETFLEEQCPTPSSDRECFPGRSTVRLEDGREVPMRDLQVGDRVLTAAGEFSDVFAWSHRDPEAVSSFVLIETDAASVEVSGGHYLPINGELVVASRARIGDTVCLASGRQARVTGVSKVRREGLYNPHTINGWIVVDGVVASTYTQAVHPRTAEALLALPKAAYRLGLGNVLGGLLHRRVPRLASFFAPAGKPVHQLPRSFGVQTFPKGRSPQSAEIWSSMRLW